VPGRKGQKPDLALAKTLRSLGEERGITRENAAHAAHLTTSSLARIELGQADPRWTTVQDIARALGVPLRDVITASGG
jgi:DNA-binding XRE family transcriptional regulator